MKRRNPFKVIGKIAIALFLFLLLSAFKQPEKIALDFKNNDRVAFIGNSITAGGLYHLYIQSYYQTRFPERKIEFYNCGISGDVASGVIARLEYDILPHKPTVAIIKLGMNDAGTSFYEKKYTSEELLSEQNRILNKYKTEMREIIQKLKVSSNPRIFIIKPTPYDQTVKLNKSAAVGKNQTLQKIGIAVEELSKEVGATVVDFYNPLNELNMNGQKSDSSFTIIGKDRVHPGPVGHLLMAYLFLKRQQVPEIVSKVEVNVNGKNNVTNAILSNFKKGKKEVSFELKENSLPFPIAKEAESALKSMPVNDFNRELLNFKGIEYGNYKLSIDDIEIGTYTSQELQTGINLALSSKTPQYIQSQAVLKLLTSAASKRTKLRDMLMAKIMMEKDKIDINDSIQLKTYTLDKKKQNPYYEMVINAYVQNKDKVTEIEAEIENDLTESRKLSFPQKHRFELIEILN